MALSVSFLRFASQSVLSVGIRKFKFGKADDSLEHTHAICVSRERVNCREEERTTKRKRK